MGRAVTPAETAALLERVRDEIVLTGRWDQGDWFFTDPDDPPDVEPTDNTVDYELPPCQWRFCLGGAIAWEALPQRSLKGKARAYKELAYQETIGEFLVQNRKAFSVMRAVADGLSRRRDHDRIWKRAANQGNWIPSTPLRPNQVVDVVVVYNDYFVKNRSSLVRFLNSVIGRLRAEA